MNIENLYEGQVIKNYKVLCEVLDIIPSSGNTKKAHFKELDRFCVSHKEGNQYIIDKIYKTPRDKIDNRNGNPVEYEQFKIKHEDRNNIGIYYILKDNDIYIGSTMVGFRGRFQNHYYGYEKTMQHTYELLQSGGKFNILYDMIGIEDEVLIRQVENEFIQYIINNTNYNVINKKENAYSVTERIRPLKNKIIKIREDKYAQAIQLLIDNGLIDSEENVTPTSNYVLDGIIQNNFDINNMPF